MELTEKENEQMRRIHHSAYGILQIKETVNLHAVDSETAQHLVQKGVAEYITVGTTKGIKLTRSGILEVNKENEK